MSAMASQITGIAVVYLTVRSGADRRKQQSSSSLAFVRGTHRWPVNSPHNGPVMRKMFPFDDVIIMNSTAVMRIYPIHVMAPWQGNAFVITNPLWGESTDEPQWDSHHKESVIQQRRFDVFCFVILNKLMEKRSTCLWSEIHRRSCDFTTVMVDPDIQCVPGIIQTLVFWCIFMGC